ncbi:MAG: DUF3800 domain-containing protein [Candidatus Pacebacteria bacterium]|nr:DUF3800 domain-containing protein [Candidatus Paceibacterota bacterium]
MSKTTHSHIAFSDDSGHEDGRFNSLCLITLKSHNLNELREKLMAILGKSGIESEFKWSKLRSKSAKYKFCAERFENFIFENIDKLRIDTLIWDMEDSRHKNLGRDDDENLARMYYHLIQNTLSKRWDNGSTWLLVPDHQSSISWRTLGEYLISKKHKKMADIFGMDEGGFINLGLKVIKPTHSHEEPFIQLADYMAGIGAYSYGHHSKYHRWLQDLSGQVSLFEGGIKSESLSNTEKIRFPLISTFTEKTKKHKMKMSFQKSGGFRTNDPRENINFWLYIPQHTEDKAPTKNPLKC